MPAFGPRLACGLLGVLLAAMVAGLNSRVPGLVLSDVQGALGFARDDASWLTTAYSAGELAAMPFATWLAITFSLRRFHLASLTAALTLAAIMPFVRDLHLLLALRALQGLFSGALIPMLMVAALSFLPLPIRLHGLALYALTATFSPNVALWLATLCVDRMADWRWAYWQAIPPGLLAMAMMAWGVPKVPMALSRLKQGNWLGMALGIPGLALLVVGVDQGVRLDWFNSPLIVASLMTGTVLTGLFLVTDWRHPTPFLRLQLLGRRNLGLGFSVFVCLLMIVATAVTLPANVLGQLQGFRLEQSATLGLIVGLPQLVLGFCVALLLYQRWVDARYVFATGLAFIAAACWLASGITSEWMVAQFVPAEILYTIGQPMAIVSLLFLATSVVQPMDGPFVASVVNTLRAFSSVLGGALIGQLTTVRGHFHSEMLVDRAGRVLPRLSPSDFGLDTLAGSIAQQASVLAAADVYRTFGLLALLLIPLVLTLTYIPAPMTQPTSVASSAVPASTTP
ncbi:MULTISPECIES: MFS transporter [Gammaproteobacteria]|uniref:MFS transporter n=1 Tax=Gammaproteobacteria TaxID=1236 RepID=UPI001C499CE2|nr:MFS transporter [Pseudomonas sp. Hp2]